MARPTTSLLLGATVGLLAAALLVPPLARGQAKADTAAAALYKSKCLMCHGANGDSKLPGLAFTDGKWKHGASVKEIAAAIADGVKGTAMLPFKGKLTAEEIESLARFVRAYDKSLK
jgi:mono/diheme cytochrome c family protein